jgi:triosephosphate isomerase
MKQIFVNLKRFDVPRRLGGVCPADDPIAWIESVIGRSIELGLGAHDGLTLAYLLPEGLVPPAVRKLNAYPAAATGGLAVGCQGVHWDDVRPGKNFGAFTTSVPATAAANLGSTWAIIGHSEERRAKLQILTAYDPEVVAGGGKGAQAASAIDRLVHDEAACALQAGLKALVCVGESADERGGGAFDEQQPRIERVLAGQVLGGLQGLGDHISAGAVVVGYEPIWAIGPGKTPPGRDYIAFVSAFIKQVVRAEFGAEIAVVYGGGLKEENAAMIAGIDTIDGGLVALTRFTGEIDFNVDDLAAIVEKYLA